MSLETMTAMRLRTISACRRCQQYTKGWQHKTFRLLLFFSFVLFVFLYVHNMGIFPSFYSLFFSFTFLSATETEIERAMTWVMQFSVEFPTLCNLIQLIRCFQAAKWQSGLTTEPRSLSSRTPVQEESHVRFEAIRYDMAISCPALAYWMHSSLSSI
ncbi:hypothetical protein LIPSTDRAFT_153781 [Lipomyces starkeyi NRRL Y-11557]|uniref:Uncharacterized protein n=1 Tax=Lipomyces starkeyi NRRL Y-11557 TaxID=675824 RepID=A0A1E3Q2U7_LIPST|nr:hypothetical protein LIPSTDRAFT_153781 [Lipomyces starkeyi NRRL Y-11557]